MTVIIGGAYQGKLKYALERFGLDAENEKDVYRCSETDTSLPKGKICYEIDKWILALIRDKQERADIDQAIKEFAEKNPDAIVICNDIFCGVVPMGADMRAWREAVGRAMVKLSKNAREVVRVFCGIPTRLK